MHVEFITPKFAKLLPHILDEIDHWHTSSASSKPVMNNATSTQLKKAKRRLLKITSNHNCVSFERKIMRQARAF